MRSLIVLYDEDCGICSAAARLLERHSAALRVAPIGSELGSHALRDLDREE
ncbi:MAG: DUF393 domain-containing protein, partial [Actinobacteria bacterium]|nr:DUF393 domain-containing protein [Actinomycetota bacterium]